MSWHIPESMAAAYVAGEVQGARAASIEAHVMTCSECRARVGGGVAVDRLDAIWSAVEDAVDAPRPSLVERFLRVIGLSDTDARLVAVAPSLHLAWLSAIVAVLALAVWASQSGERGLGMFLIVAPLVPVAAVAAAYGSWADPTYELSVSSPYPTLRLLLLRSAAVTTASGLLATAASLFVSDLRAAAAWVLPSFALVTLTLVLSRWLPLLWAAGAVCALYAVPLLAALNAHADVFDIVISRGLQWTALAVACVSVAFLAGDPQLRAALRRNQ